MPLTDTSIRNAKPAAKAVKLFDGAGLYVEVAPAGGKWWRLKYRFDGKEKRLSIGETSNPGSMGCTSCTSWPAMAGSACKQRGFCF